MSNLNMALLLRQSPAANATIVMRFFQPPPRFAELTTGAGVRVVQIADLIKRQLLLELGEEVTSATRTSSSDRSPA